MALKLRRQGQSAAPAQPDDPFRSGRNRFGLQQFRRGRDKQWHFAGQQKDEVVRLVVRKHRWFLVQPALPFIGTVILFIASVVFSLTMPQYGGQLWLLLQGVLFVLMIAAGVWFAYKDFVVWWVNTYTITNKRIISSSGLLQPSRKEITLDKVLQTGINMDSFLGVLLGYGTLHLYLAGSDFDMEQIPSPAKVKAVIDEVANEVKSKKEKEKEPPVPKNSVMATTLAELAKAKPVPKLQDVDPPPRRPNRLRGPGRTFGGPLRIPADVHYLSGEYTVKYVQRSQYVLLKRLTLPILGMIALLLVGIFVPAFGHVTGTALQYWLFFIGIVAFVLLLIMGIIYTDYADDVYIFTNRRIIDIQRRYIFFFEARLEAEYKNIRDTKVKVPGVLERLLDIGDVIVETPGSNPDIIISGIDHPFLLVDEIQRIKTNKEKADAVEKENKERKNLHYWFGTVITRLEDNVKSRGAPDLKGKDLLSAIAHAKQFGLEVTVWGEGQASPDIPPGRVISQSPPQGTLMEEGSKIEIVLSKRI